MMGVTTATAVVSATTTAVAEDFPLIEAAGECDGAHHQRQNQTFGHGPHPGCCLPQERYGLGAYSTSRLLGTRANDLTDRLTLDRISGTHERRSYRTENKNVERPDYRIVGFCEKVRQM
jgi:hypothetical protein